MRNVYFENFCNVQYKSSHEQSAANLLGTLPVKDGTLMGKKKKKKLPIFEVKTH